jgi:hypothetical protein
LDATGVEAIPNQTNGIFIGSATGNTIGGSEANQGNTISGNTINGLVLSTANSNQILGNFIGTNRVGNAAVANSNNGLELDNAVGNSVIGNLISGNSVNGVSIVNNSSGNPIQGNRIGVAADGTTGLANINSGILVNNAVNNIIGGLEAAQGNTIAFNTGDGITIINDASVGNAISGNSIYSNGAAEDNTAIGIDLANDGVTVNDALDADLGPNTLQNYPELLLAEPVDNNTVVAGRLNSLPNTTYRMTMGNAIQDIHEGNSYKDLDFTFSTGPYFDSLTLQGICIDASTGMADTSAYILLYPADVPDSAFMKQYRAEFIASFEDRSSLLQAATLSESQISGNECVFLLADSGNATATTRGMNGLIPARADNLQQVTCTLQEWHDKVIRTRFNLFASQGDGRRIMQTTTMAVINRKRDLPALAEGGGQMLDGEKGGGHRSLTRTSCADRRRRGPLRR